MQFEDGGKRLCCSRPHYGGQGTQLGRRCAVLFVGDGQAKLETTTPTAIQLPNGRRAPVHYVSNQRPGSVLGSKIFLACEQLRQFSMENLH